ncbi:permease prefix domain 1-containing protein [Nonomuraea guangzhouensis]|uniref:Permease prefix domain 1-containing protein n=1 Tax=Nonomuraea guangzhouensis TaxID=1291555 RepID=A0ABW4GB57_9ACTN|nr:permease prefix domain 1-containing protein [Nonomuraea guangzhouensis]
MRIDDYVAELGKALCGPPGPKHDLVVEARDSLADTADALEAEGLARDEAERLAVREFGAITEIVPSYQRELTAAAGRRLGLLMLISLPITVLMWSVVWRFYPTNSLAVWVARPDWYDTASRWLDILQLSTGLYGGLSLFALGRGTRWIRRPRLVTKWLGIIVWSMLPVTVGLGLVLSYGAGMQETAQTFLPAVLANLVTAAFWGLQLYGATRCLRVSRTA